MLSSLQPEIWLMIFNNTLGDRDKLNVSWTCRDFLELTLPFLYHKFAFHPVIMRHRQLPRTSLPDFDRIDREIKPLDFFASDRIPPMFANLK